MSAVPEMQDFPDILDRLARERPDQVVQRLVRLDGGVETMTYARLRRDATRLAHAFADRGVGQGSVVAVALPLGRAHNASVFAAWQLGATVLPLNARIPEWELVRLVETAAPRLVVGDVAVEALGSADVLAVLDDGDDTPLPTRVADPVIVFPSGGSTGVPKLISAFGAAQMVPGYSLGELGVQLGYRLDQPVLLATPVFHSIGFIVTYYGTLEGREVTALERFTPEAFLDAVERFRPEITTLVPTMMARVLKVPGVEKRDLSSLKTLIHAGGACPEWVKRGWIDLIGPERLYEFYTSTEQVGFTIIRGDEWLEHPGTVGRATECAVKIVGEDGRTLGPGETGEVYMRANGRTEPRYRYIGRDLGPVDDEGYASVGDLGSLDEDGYLTIVDRRLDMIVTGAANVFPAEVEATISEMAEVGDVAVIGLPDGEWGRRVHAVVEPLAGATVTAEAVRAHCKASLMPYKVPKTIEIVRALPRNEAGKLRRSALVAERERP